MIRQDGVTPTTEMNRRVGKIPWLQLAAKNLPLKNS